MDADRGLIAQPLTGTQVFNWLLLIELLVCGILVLFFLFYFNRLFATLVSYGVRAYTWHKFKVYIDIQALQLSLLGGRLFFKGVRYHGENETVFIQNGHITWRYWLRNVKQVDCTRFRIPDRGRADEKLTDDESSQRSETRAEEGGVDNEDQRPCRIAVELSGLEWFLYNRTPAYEAILRAAGVPASSEGDGQDAKYTTGSDASHLDGASVSQRPKQSVKKSHARQRHTDSEDLGTLDPSDDDDGLGDNKTEMPDLQQTDTAASGLPPRKQLDRGSLGFLALLPVLIQCSRGAIILGNENAKVFLTSTFERLEGKIDASASNPLDLYRQIFDFDIVHPVVQMRPNSDFKASQIQIAEGLADADVQAGAKSRRFFPKWHLQRKSRRAVRSLRGLIPYFQRSVESFRTASSSTKYDELKPNSRDPFTGEGRWLGLTRYLDDAAPDDHESWNHIDYARFSTLLDCPSININFYWDVPGPVVILEDKTDEDLETDVSRRVNGTSQPGYGMDVIIRGGNINYGPWADRARAEIQNVFVPNAFQDAVPARRLKAGETRQSTTFNMHVDIEQETTIRIPTRESSKDWQWRGRAETVHEAARLRRSKSKRHGKKKGDKGVLGPDIRPFGWFSVSIEPNSSVSFTMDVLAGQEGYNMTVGVDLAGTRMTSSVNHGLLWRCGPQRVSCSLPSPLRWNSLREWTFDIHSQSLDLFILRDHMFLLIDMINDWSTGPPPEYLTFVPFKYRVNLNFSNLKLYLNTNDANIIDDPADPADNTFLILGGRSLTSELEIPLDKFRPSQNSITFGAILHDVSLDLTCPAWNTLSTFKDGRPLATLKELTLGGSYNYFLTTSPTLTDSLVLDLKGTTPKIYLFGFLIRQFMKIKDNYFGEDLHFRTLEEFQENIQSNDPTSGQDTQSQKRDNDLDVMITVQADKGSVILPGNIYSRDENIQLDILLVESDLRFTNYYMDMDARFSPIEASIETIVSGDTGIDFSNSKVQLFADGVDIYGHRLFGLPPAEPTYVCNWDFHVGEISGECSTTFLHRLICSIQALTFSIDDVENALPDPRSTIIHDVTFLRAYVDSLQVWLLVQDSAVLLKLGRMELGLQDWAGPLFSERMSASVPDIVIAVVDAVVFGSHTQSGKRRVPVTAALATSLELEQLNKSPDFAKNRELQLQHVRLHDQRTRRVPWMTGLDDSIPSASMKHTPPAMAAPEMAPPLRHVDWPEHDHSQFGKSSFLSPESLRQGRAQQARERGIPSSNRRLPSTNRERGRSSHSRSHARNFTDSEQNESKSSAVYSSPWSAPHFTLAQVDPDLSGLPQMPNLGGQTSTPADVDHEYTLKEEDGTLHNSILCTFKTGLACLISPAVFPTISALITELTPRHPVDILDKLQTDCISRLIRAKKLSSKPSSVSDFRVHVPFSQVRAVHSYALPDNRIEQSAQDTYVWTTQRLKCTARVTTRYADKDDKGILKQSMLMHAASDELELAVFDRASTHYDRPATRGQVKECVFWMASGDEYAANLQIKSVDFGLWTSRFESLSAIVQRTIDVAREVVSAISSGSRQPKDCLKALTYQLTQHGKNIPDPPFLTRPSYVLRTATDHLRTDDSWKIISRLRFIYQSLPRDTQAIMNEKCVHGGGDCPTDAKARVVASLDQWLTEELSDVDQTLAMEIVWGTPKATLAVAAKPGFVGLSFGSTRLTLDPGPKRNEVAISGIEAILSVAYHLDDEIQSQTPQRTVTARTYCGKIGVYLNWEICDLIEDMLGFLGPGTAPDASNDHHEVTESDTGSQTDVHVILATDMAHLSLNSINLKIVMIARNLKGSILYETPQPGWILPVSTVMISSSSASTDIIHEGRDIMVWKLRSPNVYSSSAPIDNDSTQLELRLAGNCDNIHFTTKSEISSLAEIVDKIVEDEVGFFLTISRRLSSRQPQAQVTTTKRSLQKRFSIAMFLDNYRISVLLLPSLNYIISGDVARTALTTQGKGRSLKIDFDLQKHSHSFHSAGAAFSTMKMPPINGRINIMQQDRASVVIVDLTIEKINVDGAAIRALMDAAGRPEFRNALEASSKSIGKTKTRMQSMLAPKGEQVTEAKIPSKSDDAKVVFYQATAALAGLSVLTSAPVATAQSSAMLEFALSLVRLKLHNRGDKREEIFSQPQFEVDLRQISLELRQQRNGRSRSYGSLQLAAVAGGRTEFDEFGNELQNYRLASGGLDVELFPETATLITSIASHLQERIKGLDLSHDYRPVEKLRRLTRSDPFDHGTRRFSESEKTDSGSSTVLLDSTFAVELDLIQMSWIVPDETPLSPGKRPEDLVLSIKRIDLSTKRESSARLAIDDLQLQMVPKFSDKGQRSMNSALLPEVVFNVAYFASRRDWRLAFQAAGKALDLRLTSDFIIPATTLQASVASASHVLRTADIFTSTSTTQSQEPKPHLFGRKRLSSLLVDADFAGAVVAVQERPVEETKSPFSAIKGNRRTKASRYELYAQGEATGKAMLRAPGVAFKIEFQDKGNEDPSLNAEVKVAASKNILNPTVVPLILEISSSVKEAVGETRQDEDDKTMQVSRALTEGSKSNGDPSAILGRTRLNLGLWVQEQEFSLTCQPIARVAATARFEEIFITVNTVQAAEQNRFFSLLLAVKSLSASVQHVYSRESTASFDVQSINVSLMNSKHISSISGISAIVNISPMKTMINAKQVQDFLLFREIWYPPEIRKSQTTSTAASHPGSQAFVVQRYQQVAAATAFPLNAIISIDELAVEVDLGQSLGKTTFTISKLWTSSKKTSDLEQNLCLGFNRISVDSSGRMSGVIELQNFRLRTSIQWPSAEDLHRTPLIQASARFDGLRVKSAFDYQPFLVADVTTFEFFMFNVREQDAAARDRLFGVLEGDKVQVFCTTASASLGLALYQAIQRLVQEKQAAYEASVREMDRFLRRKSAFPSGGWPNVGATTTDATDSKDSGPSSHSLRTDVSVALKAVNLGVFPNSFFDNQVFKMEASNAEARFGVAYRQERIHSGLGLTLGQLRVALSNVNQSTTQAFGEVSVDEVVRRATGSRGGTILKVPKVVAKMETWQTASSNQIDYIFKSKFEGKVDVGWNYSRISFIRSMYANHARALANRLGKPLPPSAVQITGGPKPDDPSGHDNGLEKITAVVNVPQSRFEYTALEPPIIETPQLRDMGEATPPLEWIGLHRGRLPHLTHQIIIVSLLEISKEVEDAYSRILGAS